MAPIDVGARATRHHLSAAIAAVACLSVPAYGQVQPPQPGSPMQPGYIPGPPSVGDVGVTGPSGTTVPGGAMLPGTATVPTGPDMSNGMIGPQPVTPFGFTNRAASQQQQQQAGAAYVQPPPFFVRPRGDVEMTFTDNVAVSNTNPQSDFIVSPGAGLYAQGQTAHTSLRFDGSVAYDFYDRTTSFDGARFNAIGDMKTALIDQYLEVDARVATNQQQISVFGPTPATDRSFGQNEAQILNYGLTPVLTFHFGDFMNALVSYDFSSVDYFSTTASTAPIGYANYYSHTGRVRLSGGPDFSLLTWEVDGSIQQQDEGSYISNYRSGFGSLGYAVWPNFQLVATAGYDDIEDPGLLGQASGAYLTGGFRWAVGSRTHITFDGGERYNEPYYNARIDYTRTQAIQVHASYTETIDTPFNLLSENLASFVANPTASLTPTSGILPGASGLAPGTVSPTATTGLAPGLAPGLAAGAAANPAGLAGTILGVTPGSPLNNPNYNPYGFSTLAFRRRAVDVGLSGTIARTDYSVDIVTERVRSGPIKGDDQRAFAQLTHKLALNLQLELGASYSRMTGYNFTPGLVAKTTEGRGGLRYNLGQKTAVSLTYYYQRIIAFPVDTRENAGVLVLTRAF